MHLMIKQLNFGISIWLLEVKIHLDMILEFIKLFGIQLMRVFLDLAAETNLLEFGILDLVEMSRKFMLMVMRFSLLTSINMKTLLLHHVLMAQSGFG